MPPDQNRFLEDLAEAVLEGTAVDWTDVESRAGAADRPLIRDLRLLASVLSLHRSGPPRAAADALERWGHLRILERVGDGSSGEVFRAWDERLDREVALKLLPADPAHRSNAVIREGQLLAKVRHPNVVMIHGAEQIGDRIGLWMEFVRGRTLEQLLEQGSPFPPAEVIDIGVELSRAVSAVHAAGLLHRDIKAHNVVRAEDGRVVLMDFGTGRELEGGTSGDIAGTPLYLAPELFEEEPATVRSDVYSLGVLLYRLATGRYPVRGSSPEELRAAHQRGERMPAREAVPQRGSLARVIDEAIAPRLEQRTPTASALEASLLRLQKHERHKPLRYGAVVGAALLAVGLGAWLFRAPPPPAPQTSSPPQVATSPASAPQPATSSPAVSKLEEPGTSPSARPNATPLSAVESARARGIRPSVQILPLVNASGRNADQWLSAAAAEMLLREFRTGSFRWIPGAVPLAKVQLGIAMGTVAAETLGPVVPADVVISGDYTVSVPASGPTIELGLTVKLDDGLGGRLATLSETGTLADLVGLMSRVGARARSALGAPSLTESQSKSLLASQPANAEAARAYADGLAQPPPKAAATLGQAVEADPRFAPAFVRLAEVRYYLANELTRNRESPDAERQLAVAAAETALRLATELPEEERLLIEIRATTIVRLFRGIKDPPYREANEDTHRRLFSLFPDTLFYGYETARAYLRTGRFQEALGLIDVLSRLPGASEDLGLLELEGRVARLVYDYPRARRALSQAERHAIATGDPHLLGRLRTDQATVALELGDATGSRSYAAEAIRLYTPIGPTQADEARTILVRAYRATGDVTRARGTYEELIASARDRANPQLERSRRLGLGVMLSSQSRLSEARAIIEQVVHDSRADPKSLVIGTEDLAEVLRRQGELSTAQIRLEEMLPNTRRPQFFEGFALPVLARLHFDRGDLQAARERAERAVNVGRKHPAPSEAPMFLTAALGVLARTLLAAGEPGAARQAIDEARKLPPARATFRYGAIDVALVRARQACDEGRFADCRSAAQDAIALARGDGKPDDAAEAECAVAQGWLGAGNLREALQAIARAGERLRVTEDRLVRMSCGIAAARVQAGTKRPADTSSARQRLEALVQEAGDLGAVATALEARLALGEIEIAAGDASAGRIRLAALEAAARASGFVAIARKAAAGTRDRTIR